MSALFTNFLHFERRRVLRALLASAWVAAGCAQILGLESDIDCAADNPNAGCPPVSETAPLATPPPNDGTDAGREPAAPLTCQSYCERVQALCNTDDTRVFASQDECLAVCSWMAPETLECRFQSLDPYPLGAGAPSRACSVAGPGAAGDKDSNSEPANCESPCSAYCNLMERGICGETSLATLPGGGPDPEGPFAASHQQCVELCEKQVNRDKGYIRSRFRLGANEVICRIFHLSLAATTELLLHCEHAAGRRGSDGMQPCADTPSP